MDELERDRHLRDIVKYNEFHKGGQKEDRTTAEIIQIATALEDGAIIQCVTWLWPNMRLTITLDNHLHSKVIDIEVVLRNTNHYEFHFKPYDTGGISRHNAGLWRNSVDMSIADVVECFGLDDQKIKNPEPPTPGIWTGWFLLRYQGPRSDGPSR